MVLRKTEALALNLRHLGEVDQLVTLLTPDQGKLRVLAKGVHRPKSRLRAGIQTFTHSLIMVHHGRHWNRLAGCQPIHTYRLRESLEKLAYGLYWADLLACVVPEGEAHPGAFRLALQTFQQMERAVSETSQLNRISLNFEWQLINLLGFQLRIEHCVDCDREIREHDGGAMAIDPLRGGLICPECRGHEKKVNWQWLSPASLAILRQWNRSNRNTVFRIQLSAGNQREISSLIESMWAFHLQTNLSSRIFLQQLAPIDSPQGV